MAASWFSWCLKGTSTEAFLEPSLKRPSIPVTRYHLILFCLRVSQSKHSPSRVMKSWSVISMLPLPQGQSEYKQQGSRVSDSWLCSKNPESCQECTQVFLSEGMIQNCFSLIVHETKVFFLFVCLFVFWGGVGFWSRENGNNLERTRSSEEWRSIERESTLIAEGAQWPWGTRMSKGQRWKSKGSVRMPGGETEFGFFEDLKWGLLATLCLKGNCQEYRLKRSAGFKLPIKWWALSLAGT